MNVLKSLLLAAAAAFAAGAATAQDQTAQTTPVKSATASTPAPAAAVDPAEVEKAKAALVAVIGEIQAGAPDYTKMDERLGGIVKAQQPQMTPALAQFGKVQTVEHVASQKGMHQFKVKFEKGSTNWGIAFDATGKMSGLVVQPG